RRSKPDGVGDGGERIPVGIDRVDDDVERRARELGRGSADLAGAAAWRCGFTWHKNLQLGERARIDGDRRTGVGCLGAIGDIGGSDRPTTYALESHGKGPGS